MTIDEAVAMAKVELDAVISRELGNLRDRYLGQGVAKDIVDERIAEYRAELERWRAERLVGIWVDLNGMSAQTGDTPPPSRLQ